jgi:hypothetical protein
MGELKKAKGVPSMTEGNRFWMHVIYKNPKDFPGKYVIRRHGLDPDGSTIAERGCIIAATLEGARESLEYFYPGLYRLGRHPQDDPVIVESWV